jgi:phage/plasmid-like protein (TIGR03299 family)
MEVLPNDEVRKYAMLSNGHDGKLAVHFGFTGVRIVCTNTEAMARNSKASKLIRVKHHRFVAENVNKLREIMDLANEEFAATLEQYRFLVRRKINKLDMLKYVKLLLEVDPTKAEDDISTRQLNIITKIAELYEAGKGTDIPGVRGTWWGAYNAISEYLTWLYGRNMDTRLDSLWFGENKNLNMEALTLAVKMADESPAV